MLVLAIECSSRRGSVSLHQPGVFEFEHCLSSEQRSAQSLLPAIAEILRQSGHSPNELELIAVTAGPGSFTGLRVGVTAAKCLAYACGAVVHPINTLRVIAAQAPGIENGLLAPIIDAQRNQMFAGRYRRINGDLECESATEIVAPEAWIEELPEGTILTGAGIDKLPELPEHLSATAQASWTPSAKTVGRLAWQDYQAEGRQPHNEPFSLLPDYYRLSAAEEKRRQESN